MLLAGIALSACTSTGENTSMSLAADSTAGYPLLPDSIVTVPAAYSAETGSGGSFAEAQAIYAPKSVVAAQAGETAKAAEATNAAGGLTQTTQTPLPATADAKATPAASPVGETAVAGLTPSAETLPGVVPASYAGSTPNASAALAMQTSQDGAMSAALIHAPEDRVGPDSVAARSPELDRLMAEYAQHYDIPEELVRRVAKRESTFNPKARNGPYWGLMQIRHDTAKGMGYKGGPGGLLDAETNLKYAVRYLRGAWLVAKGNLSIADKLYQRGYYYDAKRAGLLDETGLGKDRRRRNPS